LERGGERREERRREERRIEEIRVRTRIDMELKVSMLNK
jgi:hypothetical protein